MKKKKTPTLFLFPNEVFFFPTLKDSLNLIKEMNKNTYILKEITKAIKSKKPDFKPSKGKSTYWHLNESMKYLSPYSVERLNDLYKNSKIYENHLYAQKLKPILDYSMGPKASREIQNLIKNYQYIKKKNTRYYNKNLLAKYPEIHDFMTNSTPPEESDVKLGKINLIINPGYIKQLNQAGLYDDFINKNYQGDFKNELMLEHQYSIEPDFIKFLRNKNPIARIGRPPKPAHQKYNPINLETIDDFDLGGFMELLEEVNENINIKEKKNKETIIKPNDEYPSEEYKQKLDKIINKLNYAIITGRVDEIITFDISEYRQYTISRLLPLIEKLTDRFLLGFELGSQGKVSYPMNEENKRMALNYFEEGYMKGYNPEWVKEQSDMQYIFNEDSIITKVFIKNVDIDKTIYKSRVGAKFDYIYTGPKEYDEILKDCQIYREVKDSQIPCFLFAMKQSGILTQAEELKLEYMIIDENVEASKLTKVAEKFNLNIHIRILNEDSNKNRVVKYGSCEKETITPKRSDRMRSVFINLFKNHYFYNNHQLIIDLWNKDYFKKASSYLTEDEEIDEIFDIIKKGQYQSADELLKLYPSFDKHMIDLMIEILDEGIEKETKVERKQSPKSEVLSPKSEVLNPKPDPPLTLNSLLDKLQCYSENDLKDDCKELTISKSRNPSNPHIWFADFETTTEGEVHKPYCVCASDGENELKYWLHNNPEKETLNFLRHLLKSSPESSNPIVYFHNLTYDINFLSTFIISGIKDKTGRWISAELIIKINDTRRMIYLRDSYSLIPSKLSQFTSMFNIPTTKEIMPYHLYTDDNLKKEHTGDFMMIETFVKSLEVEPSLVLEAINKSEAKIDDSHISLRLYAMYYCMVDVKVLREGFRIFREGIKSEFDLDVIEFLTISSLANKLLVDKIIDFPVFKYKGPLRAYLQQAVYGGRVMTAYNKKHKVKGTIMDFDAVSLYPSAINRLSEKPFPIGYPKFIEDFEEWTELSEEQKPKHFIVDVIVEEATKSLPFPLVVKGGGGMDGRNYVNSPEAVGTRLTVDDIMYNDLINFQGCKLKVLGGIYWPEESQEVSNALGTLIRDCFEKRKYYKSQGNPVQTIYKLILNSIYGKTIQKPITHDIRFVHEYNMDKFLDKNLYKIASITQVANSKRSLIKLRKNIDEFKNTALLGIKILSMSKRIMNEVLCLNPNSKIYYTDTDSLFIEEDDLNILVKDFEAKYNRKLVGSNLGQFHSDFPEGYKAVQSIFLGKKAYVHKLKNEKGDIKYVSRLKGIPESAIEYESGLRSNGLMEDGSGLKAFGGVIKLYEDMDGGIVEFDLLKKVDGKNVTRFKFNNNISVHTVKSFKRKVGFGS